MALYGPTIITVNVLNISFILILLQITFKELVPEQSILTLMVLAGKRMIKVIRKPLLEVAEVVAEVAEVTVEVAVEVAVEVPVDTTPVLTQMTKLPLITVVVPI